MIKKLKKLTRSKMVVEPHIYIYIERERGGEYINYPVTCA
jgi:hypothetical protein